MVLIIGVLALISVQHFADVSTRTQVTAMRSSIKTVKNSIAMYRIDTGAYPSARPVGDRDPLGILADVQLSVLTTPLAYASPASFRDAFGRVRNQMIVPEVGPRDGSPMIMPNSQLSLLYIHYPSFSALIKSPDIDVDEYSLISLGPDLADSFGAFSPFPDALFPPLAKTAGTINPSDSLYDPTNGTMSGGDLVGFSGRPAR